MKSALHHKTAKLQKYCIIISAHYECNEVIFEWRKQCHIFHIFIVILFNTFATTQLHNDVSEQCPYIHYSHFIRVLSILMLFCCFFILLLLLTGDVLLLFGLLCVKSVFKALENWNKKNKIENFIRALLTVCPQNGKIAWVISLI